MDKTFLNPDFSLKLPIDGLPCGLQGIILDYAKALNAPTEFVTAVAFQAIAQAAGNRFRWSNDLYTNFPQFYFALMGGSSDRKSTTMNNLFKPLSKIDDLKRKSWFADKSEDKKPLEYNIIDDYTLEGLQLKLSHNPNGVTTFCDEILSFFGSFDKYRNGKTDEKFYLTAFATSKSYTVVRVSKELSIENPIPRIIGGFQPDLVDYFRGSKMLSDGMLPRFLWVFMPDDFIYENAKIDIRGTSKQWENIINKIFYRQSLVNIIFDKNAQELYDRFKDKHCEERNKKVLFGYEAAVCGKLEIYAIMVAMVVCVARAAEDSKDFPDELVIYGKDMEYSIKCMDYFRKSAMQVYKMITGESSEKKIGKYEWVRIGLNNGWVLNQKQFAESVEGMDSQKVSDIKNGRR